MVAVVLQYFPGCPNWTDMDGLLRDALDLVGDPGARVEMQQIDTLEDAVATGFTGSPTVLVNGRDPFAVAGTQPGLACRVYPTPEGLRGTPTLAQLVAALRG